MCKFLYADSIFHIHKAYASCAIIAIWYQQVWPFPWYGRAVKNYFLTLTLTPRLTLLLRKTGVVHTYNQLFIAFSLREVFNKKKTLKVMEFSITGQTPPRFMQKFETLWQPLMWVLIAVLRKNNRIQPRCNLSIVSNPNKTLTWIVDLHCECHWICVCLSVCVSICVYACV